MNQVFVIADLHLGHDKAAKFRGFSSGIDHDERISENWRRTVTKRDVVYVLGDVFDWQQLSLLPGIKKLAMGNHDRAGVPLLSRVFTKWHAMFVWDNCLLTHIPVHPGQRHRWRRNVHGHTHEHKIDDPWYVCVSAEQIGYTPILLRDAVGQAPTPETGADA